MNCELLGLGKLIWLLILELLLHPIYILVTGCLSIAWHIKPRQITMLNSFSALLPCLSPCGLDYWSSDRHFEAGTSQNASLASGDSY